MRLKRRLRNLLPATTLSEMRQVFDFEHYKTESQKNFPDEQAAFHDYMKQGWAEGFNPHPLFDTEYYLEKNPDVSKSGVHPLYHFIRFGWQESRNPSRNFHLDKYLQQNPDVAAASMNPLLHYITVGYSEGRFAPSTEQFTSFNPVSLSKRGQAIGSRRDNTHTNKGIKAARAKGPRFDISPLPKSKLLDMIVRAEISTSDKPVPGAITKMAKDILKEVGAPTISVVMPTWNRELSVCKAIDSILEQSLLPTEIIVVDDGSTDQTVSVLKTDYADELKTGLIKIVQERHVGVSHARNQGLKIASGELIAYLDSDNCWRPDYLLLAAAILVEDPVIDCTYTSLKSINRTTGEERFRATPYDRTQLIANNFIDLNVFMHKRILYDRLGGFDEKLSRLVDWDLIVRYTTLSEPTYLPFCGVEYYLDRDELGNISFTEDLDQNYRRVARKNRQERLREGVEPLRLAYFIYDFPALSQTFVLGELRWLVANGIDVKVYHSVDPDKACEIDFPIDIHRIDTAEQFAELLLSHDRNMIHGHFAYPGTTLFVEPASASTEIPYTFMAHAVDIFHHNNRQRSRVPDIVNNDRCIGAFVHGDYHRKFLESLGADRSKIKYVLQSVDPLQTKPFKGFPTDRPVVGVFIGRLIEKKGFKELIEASVLLRDANVEFHIWGYGPLLVEAEKVIAENKLNNVILQGTFEGKERLETILHEADFLICPCKEAVNGDLDGFPTVILEAMSAGVPVVTTGVSSVPHYLRDGIEAFVLPDAKPETIDKGVRSLLNLSSGHLKDIVENGLRFTTAYVGTEKTVSRLLDTWYGYAIDVFLVCYNTEEYDDRDSTFEIVSRLLNRTQAQINLFIIDNGSDVAFKNKLLDITKGIGRAKVIFLNKNIFCGPASNLALSLGDSEFAVYICSKEGFVTSQGWDRSIIEEMRSNPSLDLTGYETHLPRFTTLRELTEYPDFHKFRETGFAEGNPDQPFTHMQGGILALRREAVDRYGGFSPQLPQNGMDIEYSYYLKSKGAVVANSNHIRSLSIKTRPGLQLIMDETTSVAHPLAVESVAEELDICEVGSKWRCNLCGQIQTISTEVRNSLYSDRGVRCSNCGSNPFARSMAYWLAHDHRTHRHLEAAIIGENRALHKFLSQGMFQQVHSLSSLQPTAESNQLYDVICVNSEVLALGQEHISLLLSHLRLDKDPLLLLYGGPAIDEPSLRSLNLSLRTRKKSSRFLMLGLEGTQMIARYHKCCTEDLQVS